MATQAALGALMWEYRLHAAAAVALIAAAAVSLSTVGPSLGAVVSFFWPLLVSTGFFLVAVAVLLRISPPPPGADASGEELIDFVAGCRPEHHSPPVEASPSAAMAAEVAGAEI